MKMHCAEFLSIVLYVCVQMAIVVNQLRDVQDQSVQLIMIAKSINNAKVDHAEIHVCNLAHAVSMHSVALSIERSSAHAHQVILEIQPSNVLLRRMLVLATHVVKTQDAVM